MNEKPDTNWSLSTWEGARREELKRWRKLSLNEKLDAVDQLNELGAKLIAARKAKGLPYLDPNTGKRVSRSSANQSPRPS